MSLTETAIKITKSYGRVINQKLNKPTLLSVTTQLLPYIGYPRTLNALKCLNEVIPE